MGSPLFFSPAISGHLRRRWRWAIVLAVAGVSGYGAYRIYSHTSVIRRLRRLTAVFGAAFTLSEAVTHSAEVAALISSDLHGFLCSDSDDIPLSLKQISKIATSIEFSGSLSKLSEALTIGVVRGIGSDRDRLESGHGFPDRALDKLFSSGSGFVSDVVGSFARNLVLGFYEAGDGGPRNSESSFLQMIAADEFRVLFADSIQRFVATAVTVYLDKTMDINMYEELFSGLTNPSYETRMKEMLVAVCNGAMETLVQTSHQVLSTSKLLPLGDCNIHDSQRLTAPNGGLVHQFSATMAVPNNRRFVLDLTGRVTFETVRSLMEFFLLKLSEGTRRTVNAARKETMEIGLEVLRHFSAKSVVIYTICFALCIHILLLPA